MNGYVFYCSKCKFDHAGECKIHVSIEVDPNSPRKARDILDDIQALVKALEAGSYNAKPGTLHQCKRNPHDCDVCYPPGSVSVGDVMVDADNITLSYRVKMAMPLKYIPITFQIA